MVISINSHMPKLVAPPVMVIHHNVPTGRRARARRRTLVLVLAGLMALSRIIAPGVAPAHAATPAALGGVVVEPDGAGARIDLALSAAVHYAASASSTRIIITLDGVVAASASHHFAAGPVTGIAVRPVRAAAPRVVVEVATRVPMHVTEASFADHVLVVRVAPRSAQDPSLGHPAAGVVSPAPDASRPVPREAGASEPAESAGGQTITLDEGAGRLLAIAGLVRVAVADPRVLGVVPVSSGELLVTGRSPGRTTMYVWDRVGRVLTYTVEVVPLPDRLGLLRRLIASMFPTAAITVTEVPAGGTPAFVVPPPSPPGAYGGAPTPDLPSVPRGQAVAPPAGFAPTAVSGTPARPGVGGPDTALAPPPTPPAVPAAGGVVLSGSVETQMDRQKIEAIARAFAPTVVDLLAVRRPVQLKLQVEVVELDRNALRNLGVTWGGGEQTPGSPPSLNGGVYNLQLLTGPGGGTVGLDLLIAQLQALVQQGRARLLAEPSLVVLAGMSASLLLGGQVPIPIAGPNGSVTVEYKDFGVILDARPEYQDDGRVFMHIAPEVSTLDFSDAIKVSGFTIPALRVRRATTVVSMLPSQTLVLGGLLQHQDATLVQKLPLLGDLPVIGPLFRSSQFQHQETDLVIFVTPAIADAGEAPPHTP